MQTVRHMRAGAHSQGPPARPLPTFTRYAPRLRSAVGVCSILVVDDESILMAVAEFLELEGYQVEAVTNGADALTSVDRHRPSVVVLDMRMPVLDGWGFAQALHDRGIALPLVVMTASHHTRQWAEEIGAADYIAKPFDLTDLLAAVNRICASQ